MKNSKCMRVFFPFSASMIASILFFSSCDPNSIDNQNTSDSTTNYWNSSTLIHQHLNGKVKTVVSGIEPQVDAYNEAGFILSSTASDGSIVTSYIYDSPGVLNTVNTSFVGFNKTFPTTYKYLNAGKFIVVDPYDLTRLGLIPNLSSMTNTQYGITNDYKFNGNILLLISSYSNKKDTAVITYNGQYPTDIKWHSSTDLLHIKDIVYYSNGMFKAYTIESSATDNLYQTKYYFEPETKYQLIDSIVTINATQSKTTHSKVAYSYDANRNVTHYEVPNLDKGYTDIYDISYVYDSHNNWTSKTTRSTESTDLNVHLDFGESRTITYWE